MFKYFQSFMGLEEDLLYYSLAPGDNDMSVKLLVKHGANVNKRFHLGETAAMKAAGKGHFRVVRSLIESGANVNEASDYGGTALMKASYQKSSNQVYTVKMLIELGADVNKRLFRGETAAIITAGKGHCDVVKVLIENGAKVNETSDFGGTALMNAAYYNQVLMQKSFYVGVIKL